MAAAIHWIDIVILIVYFVFVLSVGLWTLCRPNRSNVKSYFLAGRDMTWFPIGTSLFASNIGSEHFIGLAGTGAAAGIAIVIYEWMSMPLVLLLSWVFLPVYISAGVFTLPEYLQRRYGGQRLRVYLSCISLMLYVVTKIAVCIYAGALFIQMSLGWDMYISIVTLLAITSVYTILGGLAAVIYTDAVQTVVMTGGAVALAIISFVRIDGYENLKYQYMRAVSEVRSNESTCGFPRSDALSVIRDPINSDNPWPGLFLQSSIGCLWYWCADQVIVQRALAAKNISHAKGATILAGYLKLLPLFLMVFPGMISRALYPDEVACSDPEECRRVCGISAGCSNIAYPKLVMTLLPVGLRGLLLAVMMSAIMSSLTSIFNSASTLFTMDLWTKARPKATQREMLIVGRVMIVVMCGISILWIPLLQSSAGGQLFIYIQSIQGYIGTPISALFLLAVFCPRINERGAFYGIVVGHCSGLTRMILDFVYAAPDCGHPDNRPAVVASVHYTYFSLMNLVLTTVVMVVVSLLTTKQDDKELNGVTWWTKTRHLYTKKSTNAYDKTAAMPESAPIHEVPDDVIADKSFLRRWCNTVCGLPEDNATSDAQSKETHEDRMKLLHENKAWRKVLNVNAVIGMSVMAFLCGFFY